MAGNKATLTDIIVRPFLGSLAVFHKKERNCGKVTVAQSGT
jgi:hypothetical protein